MSKKYQYTTLLVLILFAIVTGYYFISPKVILENLSDQEYDEFIVTLPLSRVSFSPIEGNSSNKIYYSSQKEDGNGNYSLILNGVEISSGKFIYDAEGELGRVLRFSLGDSGLVTIDKQNMGDRQQSIYFH